MLLQVWLPASPATCLPAHPALVSVYAGLCFGFPPCLPVAHFSISAPATPLVSSYCHLRISKLPCPAAAELAVLTGQLAASCIDAYCCEQYSALGCSAKSELTRNWLSELLLVPLLRAACRWGSWLGGSLG